MKTMTVALGTALVIAGVQHDRVDPYGPPVVPVIRYGNQEVYVPPWTWPEMYMPPWISPWLY